MLGADEVVVAGSVVSVVAGTVVTAGSVDRGAVSGGLAATVVVVVGASVVTGPDGVSEVKVSVTGAGSGAELPPLTPMPVA